jgi:hypothetical protein
MGRGRGRFGLLGAILGVALVLAGCGTESHENRPRPPVPVAVTVSISERGVLLQPSRIGFSGEPGTNISQNEDVEEPEANPKAPLPVTFTISNVTGRRTALLVNGTGEVDEKSPCPVIACSQEIVPGGTSELKTSLDSGGYRISAEDIANGKAVPFEVGPNRTSSQQDLLLP